MLPLAQLGENTGFLALFLEATDGALDGLVLLDPNPCHALHSPPLRAPAAATVPRRWMSGEGTIKQKPWSVKVGSRTSARRRRTSGRKLQESLREIGEDAVDARHQQAVEIGLRIHRPHADGEPCSPRCGDRRGGGRLLAEMQGSRTDALRKANRVGDGVVLPEDGERRRRGAGPQPLEGTPREGREDDALRGARPLDDGERPGLEAVVVPLRLELDVHGKRHRSQDLGEGRHPLTREGGPEPASRIQPADLGQGERRERAGAVGGALERRVVEHHHLTVARELYVELDHVGTELDGAAERRHGVLGMRATGPTVGDHEATHAPPIGGALLPVNRSAWHRRDMEWVLLRVAVPPATAGPLVDFLLAEGAPAVVRETEAVAQGRVIVEAHVPAST